ncbi:post-transcriptional regulator [Paenibacillus sp. N1-5-1-14]|uniref:post-transcriptional regulator n=1 Tax=Paenibacillus radicibacter TaxID=2972488 RepID=UPI0021595079|nr:post-transcriptional regulator [Paenibacillus radicibacter]MCR8644107.1 post-transcriptional regulator [Paenibacillus radicibacter]
MRPEDQPIVEEQELTESELSEMIQDMCKSKAEEICIIGYIGVTDKDIWDCVSEKYRKSGTPQLHQMVNDILSLKPTQFMNWMTMQMYKGS